jgi:hypothetical protein
MKKKTRHVVVAIPAYTGLVHCGTMRSVLYDVISLINGGDVVRVVEEVGNADIARCRSMIVAKFLAQRESTHLVMVDSDVCWEPGGMAKLLNAGVEFVCGAYPQRIGDGTKYHMRMKAGTVQSLDPKTGLLEVEAMPAGFMCLSRAMLQRMVDAYPDSKFSFRECPGGIAHDLFDAYWETDETGLRHKLGEDYSFCRRWRDIGGQVWVDPSIAMGHIGTKMWSGKLSESFRAHPSEAAA